MGFSYLDDEGSDVDAGDGNEAAEGSGVGGRLNVSVEGVGVAMSLWLMRFRIS